MLNNEINYKKISIKNQNRIKLLIIFVLVFFIVLYLYFENTTIQVSNYDIVNSAIPKEFENFKIIQISDFHNTSSNKLTNNLIKVLVEQKPNIIVLTGDCIDSYRTDINTAILFMKKIKDIAPVYFVSGNHESRVDEYTKLKEKMRKNNINILENRTEVLEINTSKINLIGIDDPTMVKNSKSSDSEIILEELNKINFDKDNYNILLSHRPELFDTYVDNKIDLVLTGHAHGGQIRIPFIGGLVAPNQGLFPKYTSGKFIEEKTTMIVSRGIGNSIFPFRINNKPEVVVVNLKVEK